MREVSIAAGHLFTKARQQYCEAPKYASFHTFQVVPESRAAPHMQIEQWCLVLPGWSLKKGQLPTGIIFTGSMSVVFDTAFFFFPYYYKTMKTAEFTCKWLQTNLRFAITVKVAQR